MTKTFIIAEAGANHNRDWDTATKLIDAAVKAEADAVKFQTYSSETLYASNTPDFAGYSNINKLIRSGSYLRLVLHRIFLYDRFSTYTY